MASEDGISEIGKSQLAVEQNTLETCDHQSDTINKASPNVQQDAYTDADTNTDELRSRIESFNTQLKARSPSFLGKSEKSDDIHNRTGSVGDARRPSFIEGHKEESNNLQAASGEPARSNFKRRQKTKVSGQKTNDTTNMALSDKVPGNQNKADPDNNQNNLLSKRPRHDSASSGDSICQSGGSMSSYEADPELPFSQAETSCHQLSVQPS